MSAANGNEPDSKDRQPAPQKFRGTRIGKELEYVASVALTGRFLVVGAVFLHLASLWIVLLAALQIYYWVAPPPKCALDCLGGVYAASCCARDASVVGTVLIGSLVTFLISLASTRRIRRGRFRHSALLTSLFIVTLACVFLITGMTFSHMAGLFALSFFTMYFGYRAAFFFPRKKNG